MHPYHIGTSRFETHDWWFGWECVCGNVYQIMNDQFGGTWCQQIGSKTYHIT